MGRGRLRPRGGPHHAEHCPPPYPPPPCQDMQGALVTQWTPDKKHAKMLANATKFLGMLEQQQGPTYAPLFLGGGLEAHLGLAVEDLRDDIFNPRPARPPRVHSPPRPSHPLRGGSQPGAAPCREMVLWRWPYQLEVAKKGRTGGDALAHSAVGGFLPLERLASAWQLLNDAPPFTNAK